MLKGLILGVLLTIVVAAACTYIVLSTGAVPAAADGKPILLERWAARTSLRATLAREAPKGADPVPLTDANLITGIDLYGQRCARSSGLVMRSMQSRADSKKNLAALIVTHQT